MLKWRIREILKQLFQIVWYLAPKYVRNSVQHAHDEKKAKRTKEIFSQYRVSEEDVYAAMDQLGISGDVMIHTSLVDIGNVKGAHKPFVNYLQQHVIDKGNTVLAIGIPMKGSTASYLHSITKFDKDAPIAMGRVSTYYAKQDGACRSLNPTHSIIAAGASAEEYTATHHLDKTPFGEHSPYYKFLQNNGHMLLIGAGIKYMTIGHIIEDMLGDNFPCRVYERKPHPVDIYRNGECIYHGKYYAHSSWRGVFRVVDYVISQVRKIPSMRVAKLGASEILYFSAREAILCELEELRKGNSFYGYRFINNRTQKAIDKWIETIQNMQVE